jgi:hypothetical protein
MDIILHGKHNGKDAAENLESVLRLLKERYNIDAFREMHLTITMVDNNGDDVELINNETGEVYRFVEIYNNSQEFNTAHRHRPILRLVIDNT